MSPCSCASDIYRFNSETLTDSFYEIFKRMSEYVNITTIGVIYSLQSTQRVNMKSDIGSDGSGEKRIDVSRVEMRDSEVNFRYQECVIAVSDNLYKWLIPEKFRRVSSFSSSMWLNLVSYSDLGTLILK